MSSRVFVCSLVLTILVSLFVTRVQAATGMSASPASLSFGSINENSSSPAQSITVLNTGNQKITISNVVSSSSQFKVSGSALPITLHAGQGATFQVVFDPTSTGALSGNIKIHYNRYSRNVTSIPVSGTGLPPSSSGPPPTPVLSASPSALNLGSVMMGSSVSQTASLTNTGTGSVTISSVGVTGAGFSATGMAVPLTLAAGQSTSVTVGYSPAGTGSASGSVSVMSNAANSPTTIALTGSGTAQTRLLTPSASSLSFGSVMVGKTSSTQTISVTNSGNSSVSISSLAIIGAGFTGSGMAIPLTLGAGQSTTLSVAFSPTATGNVTGSVSIVSNATNSPATIALTGSGSSQTLQLTPSANSLSFGNTLVGSTSSAQTATLTNTGNASVTISQVTAAGTGFTATAVATPLTLTTGQSVSVSASFAPTATGAATGSLTVVSNATNSPTTIALSGTGTQPQISMVPASVAFGTVAVGVTNTQAMTIKNTGTASLSVTQATLSGQGFAVSGLTLPLTVAAGGSASFTLGFTPTSATNFSSSLSLVSNAPGSPLAVPLTGAGLAQTLQLSVSPSTVSFGSQNVGTSSSQSVTISNTGNSAVNITQITLTGTAYSATGFSLPLSLGAGQNTGLTLVFAPIAAGNLPGSVSIISNASNSPATVTLSGSGVQPASSSVSLSWADSASGLSGYNVYRGTATGGPYAKVNSALVPSIDFAYTDTTVQSGSTYYYVTRAVDSTGTESLNSNEASAQVP